MSLSDRRTLLRALAGAGALAALGACGFRPAHAPGGAGSALQGRVRPAAPGNDVGFDFVVAIEERLGRATAPAYDLGYTISLTSRGDSLLGTATYQLTDIASGQVVTSGQVASFVTNRSGPTPLASTRAREDADRRLARALADLVVARLLAAGLE